jgi:hypothetical protein
MTEERDPREPRNLPSELAAVWRKHRALADKYELEHAYSGFGERYYNLQMKHEHVCEYLERANANERSRARYRALRDRIEALPCDWDKDGNAGHVIEAVRALKSDLIAGKV